MTLLERYTNRINEQFEKVETTQRDAIIAVGNMIAETVFRLLRIEEPIARGVALGTSAHAIGTAKALELGEVEGAMSSLSIAVAGILTVFGASLFAGFL